MTELAAVFDHCQVGGSRKGRWQMDLRQKIHLFLRYGAKPSNEAKQKECAMKMKPAQVERTLSQFGAQAIPDDHPVVPQLNSLFGDHTFFLDSNGLSVVEPTEFTRSGVAVSGMVVKLANWNDPNLTSLAPQEPEPTDIIVALGTEH
jgi:hypothetical protein